MRDPRVASGPLVFVVLVVLLLAPHPIEARATDSGTDHWPRRIVALAPNLVELLFALDLGERVVGVGDHSRWPPEVEELPRLGGLVDPHLERLLSLDPDLAVLLPSQQGLATELRRLGIDVLVVESETIGDVAGAARAIARHCGVPGRGDEFVERWSRELAPRSVETRPRVLLVIGRHPGDFSQVLVAGPGTFLDELLERAGGRNAFDDVSLPWPQVSLESVLDREPEVVVELHGRSIDETTERRLVDDWSRFAELGGERSKRPGGIFRVVVIDATYALLPGPRLPRLYEDLRAALGAAP